MRKLNVLEFVSLDGVIQAPGGPEEDTSGGFAYGGWTSPHSDAVSSAAIKKQMNLPFDLLICNFRGSIWVRLRRSLGRGSLADQNQCERIRLRAQLRRIIKERGPRHGARAPGKPVRLTHAAWPRHPWQARSD